jgi:hypothetical protein
LLVRLGYKDFEESPDIAARCSTKKAAGLRKTLRLLLMRSQVP